MIKPQLSYCSNINISDSNKKKLLKLLMNNLIAYNYFYEYFTTTKQTLKNREKKRLLVDFIKKNDIYPYNLNAMLNEIYYLEKKMLANNFETKKLYKIQYLTILDDSISIDFEKRLCKIKNTDIEFYLSQDLEEEIYLRKKYINISYCSLRDKFEFKIFT